jgi:hypothetical protein
MDEINYEELVKKAKNFKNGVKIKNRTYKFKTYPFCFISSELVDWLLKHFDSLKRDEMIKICKKLYEKGSIEHCAGKTGFEDGFFFYRWTDKPKVL